eukprot:6484727-Amphidinium_carterae.1
MTLAYRLRRIWAQFILVSTSRTTADTSLRAILRALHLQTCNVCSCPPAIYHRRSARQSSAGTPARAPTASGATAKAQSRPAVRNRPAASAVKAQPRPAVRLR